MKFTFEAMDATGHEIRDTIEAESEGSATIRIRQMGYFVTKIQAPKVGGNDCAIISAKSKLDLSRLHWFLIGFVTASLMWLAFLAMNATYKSV